MNKIPVALSLTLLTTTTFAQIKFAPEAGLNMAMQTSKIKINDISLISTETSKLSPGGSGGIMGDLMLLKKMYLQAGIFYFYNNIKYSSEVDLSAYQLGTPSLVRYDRIHSLRLPLFLMYKSGFEGSGRFTAGIGPYVNYSFSGNRVLNTPFTIYDSVNHKVSGYTIRKSNTDLKIGNQAFKDDIRNWDFGLNACIGYESNVGLYFRSTFSYGLLNQDPANTDNYKVRNWGFGFSIGYFIGKDGW